MRVRRLAALTVGAAMGAGAMYLLDPEHGEQRRRLARRRAFAQARQGTVRALHDAREHAQSLAVAAVAGYQQGRARAEDDRPPRPTG